MTVDEQIADYLARSGDPEVREDTVIAEGKGFASMEASEGVLYIHQCYGDGKWWVKAFREIAQANQCHTIMFSTARNPKPFERKYRARVVGYIMELPIWEA